MTEVVKNFRVTKLQLVMLARCRFTGNETNIVDSMGPKHVKLFVLQN